MSTYADANPITATEGNIGEATNKFQNAIDWVNPCIIKLRIKLNE